MKAHIRLLIVTGLAICAALWAMPGTARGQFIDYLQVPPSGILSPGGVGPQVFNLPNYGNVEVSLTNASTATTTTFFDQTGAYNQSAGPYTWGTDTQRFNVLNANPFTEQYNFNFNFLSGAPDPSRLLLVVAGLAVGTTVTVSQPGSLVGEYTFPFSPSYPQGPSSTTVLTGQTFSTLANGDPKNTGWALFAPAGTYTSLSLSVDQFNGDGIGFTLGYTAPVPEPTVTFLLCLGVAAMLQSYFGNRFKRR